MGVEVSRYPTPLMKNLMQILITNRIKVVLDVGANEGFYAKDLRKMGYKNRIVSFEPLLDSYNILQQYAVKSKWQHQVIHTALGEYDGKSVINVSQNSVSSSILDATNKLGEVAPQAKYYRKEEINICKLDSIFQKYCNPEVDVILLKIDAQGYEKKIFEGAVNSLIHIKAIQIEVSLVELYSGEWLLDDLLGFMKQAGYVLYMVWPGFSDPDTGRQLQIDCIFLKESK